MKKKCIICGKEEDVVEYKLPHGTIHLCHNNKCSRLITYRINNSCPIVWVGEPEIMEEYENDSLQEAFGKLTEEEVLQAARDTEQCLWNDDMMGNMYHEALEMAQQYLEQGRIEKAPLEKLPLMLNSLYFEKNKEVLKERLKNAKEEDPRLFES